MGKEIDCVDLELERLTHLTGTILDNPVYCGKIAFIMDASTEGFCRDIPAHLISSYRKKSGTMLLRK